MKYSDRQIIALLGELACDQMAKLAEACARNSSMAVELAAMQQERNAALDRAWRAETSLSHSYSLWRDIASELGCADLTGEAQLEAGLAYIRNLKGELSAATERNGNLSVEIAAVTQERDALRREVAALAKGAAIFGCPRFAESVRNCRITKAEDYGKEACGACWAEWAKKAVQAGKDVAK